jgi:hypothetical protein
MQGTASTGHLWHFRDAIQPRLQRRDLACEPGAGVAAAAAEAVDKRFSQQQQPVVPAQECGRRMVLLMNLTGKVSQPA